MSHAHGSLSQPLLTVEWSWVARGGLRQHVPGVGDARFDYKMPLYS